MYFNFKNREFIYNSVTGELIRFSKPGREAGHLRKDGYRYVSTATLGAGKQLLAHRIIWNMVYKKWPNEIDHVNGVRDDNRLSNLREVDDTGNAKNNRLYKNNKSGCIGVHWYKRTSMWRAEIQSNNKAIFLGYFTSKDDAIKARKDAEIKYGFHKNHGRTTDSK